MPWNENMTKVIQIIKQKIQNFPKLHLPDMNYPFIIETYAPDEVWGSVFITET